jgi:hypothetical protein
MTRPLRRGTASTSPGPADPVDPVVTTQTLSSAHTLKGDPCSGQAQMNNVLMRISPAAQTNHSATEIDN